MGEPEQEMGASCGPGSREPSPAVSAASGFDPSRWNEISNRADADTGDEEEDSYHIGVRDGFCEAVQLLDTLTGGDGEYRYCLGAENDERHCPGPDFMIARILARFRDRDGAEGGDANAAPVPQDRQARAEGIAQKPDTQPQDSLP